MQVGREEGGLLEIYHKLERTYPLGSGWPEGDWPLSHRFRPARLEVVVGAILTQNVSWSNVEKAISRLIEANLTGTQDLLECPRSQLEEVIRPAGFFRQKAERMQRMARFIRQSDDFYGRVGREELLALPGVGPETADSILLYACNRLHFVVDAYTGRLLSRYGLVDAAAGYPEIQGLFHLSLPPELSLYKRFHALIVEHAKQTCKKRPVCEACVLRQECQEAQLGVIHGTGRQRSDRS